MMISLLAASLITQILAGALVTKSAAIVSDPINGTVTPQAIPGAFMDYTISVTNNAVTALDSGTVIVADVVPAQTKLYVSDLAGTGKGPIAFTNGVTSSGMAFTFTSLASPTDDVDFSQDGGVTYTYTPVPDGDGCDAAVNAVRLHPHGADNVAGVFTLRFRVKVK